MTKGTHTRRWWWIGGAVAAVLAALWAWNARRAIALDVAEVAKAPLEVVVVESGETRAVNRVIVSAPVTGLLRPSLRIAGGGIRANDLIASIDPAPLDSRMRREMETRGARAEALRDATTQGVRAADSVLADAERQLARADQLLRAGGIATRDRDLAAQQVEQARTAQLTARAQQREVNAEQEAVRAALAVREGAPVMVRAPVNGRVLTVHERDVRVVPAGTPLVTLGDVRQLEVRVEVLSRDVLQIAPGQPMLFDIGADLESVPGVVDRIEGGGFVKLSPLGVEERRVVVVGRPTQALPDVGDGYRVQTRIVVWSNPSVLQAPASSFVRDAEGWAVLLLRGGRVVRQRVVPGARGESAWEVREGLSAGDAVVRYPDKDTPIGVRARPQQRP